METFGVPKENPAKEMIQVRLVHSMNSTVGKVMVSCISMALSDFYGVHADYHTRLSLHVRDPEDDTIDAASVSKHMHSWRIHCLVLMNWIIHNFKCSSLMNLCSSEYQILVIS
ncbi:hypothetical protein ACJRO7_015140 [Eucalyptus globulus]|uniref:Uncharacterized protein n=1 Tax=Eucalyptus globulus TaxID=34317 RepID=A0ABD3L8D6_EUCGL